MRQIDADALLWKLRADPLHELVNVYGVDGVIESAPTVDAVPVVRCSECKHRGWIQEPCHGKSVDYCRQLERPVDKRFFCGLGERQDETEAETEALRREMATLREENRRLHLENFWLTGHREKEDSTV